MRGQARELAYGSLGPVRFSPDGRFAAFTVGGCQTIPAHVAVVRTDTWAGVGHLTGSLLGWAPRGLRLLYERGSSLQLVTSDPFGHHRWVPARISERAWIAFGGAGGTYFVRSNEKGLRRVSGAPLLSTYTPLLWSPDSGHFAFVDADGVVRVVTPPQASAVSITTAASDLDVCRMVIDLPVCQLAWARDRLLFASHGP
jgi:hypothetical protein